MPTVQDIQLSASDIAKYFLLRATLDGDLITPLKMQKLVYLAYAKTLASEKKKLFGEQIEAWPMGPVIRDLYYELRKYGSSPIPQDYVGKGDVNKFSTKIPADLKKVVDEVYETYIGKSAFELVSLVHEDEAWKKARYGLSPEQSSSKRIPDEDIMAAYS